MPRFRRGGFLAALFLTTALLASACGGGGAPSPAPAPQGQAPAAPAQPAKPAGPKVGGMIIYGTSGDPVNFNPILQSDTTSGWVVDRVFDGVTEVNEKLEVVCVLCESWTVGSDNKSYTIKLKKGVKFHDGKELTAEDVAFTYNAIKSKEYTGPRTSSFLAMEKAEVVDPYTVKFILKEPFAPFLLNLGYGVLPKHLYEGTPIKDWKEHPNNLKPIGTGPWKFKEWVKGQYITLERNPNYHREGPYIETVQMKFYQDQNVLAAAFENGDIDILTPAAKDVDRLKQALSKTVNWYTYPTLSFTYVGINHTVPGLEDVNVRRALAHAINRPGIIKDILEGKGELMHSHMPPASWAFTPDVPKYDYDPKKAVELLEKAGYTRGPDGIFQKGGKRLSFELLTNSGNTTRESVALLMQKNLKDVGIEVKPAYVEWSQFLEKHLWVGNYQLFISGFSLGTDPDAYLFYHSSQAKKNDKGRFLGFNRYYYNNPEIDKLLEDGRRELDKEKRKAIYAEFQKKIAADVPIVWLFTQIDNTGIKNQFQGIVLSPIGPMQSFKWYVADVK